MPTGIYKRKPLTEIHKKRIGDSNRGKWEYINCKFCNKIVYTKESAKRKYCSKKCVDRDKVGKYVGENNPTWTKNPSYTVVHQWMNKTYGHSKNCEHCKKVGKYIIYERQNQKIKRWSIEWALKKGCKYERKRENFLYLCVSCHRLYDGNTGVNRKNGKFVKCRICSKEIYRIKCRLNKNGNYFCSHKHYVKFLRNKQ